MLTLPWCREQRCPGNFFSGCLLVFFQKLFPSIEKALLNISMFACSSDFMPRCYQIFNNTNWHPFVLDSVWLVMFVIVFFLLQHFKTYCSRWRTNECSMNTSMLSNTMIQMRWWQMIVLGVCGYWGERGGVQWMEQPNGGQWVGRMAKILLLSQWIGMNNRGQNKMIEIQ